ncbi:endonuclease [Nocardioides gansuensis]|uniref:Endonuclease n=1 Tax=Nocardioides gansuensis TaxID=2138300 RepID=A0A2T8F5H8_9ACTN|nr:endonuclease/exonuclease/phosphatase family protein [Nocardioides gansuensis]PVG80930.1 endonuclease [Nocardioides gansuensis]
MRLATFNILHGRSPVDQQVDVDRYAKAIESLDADVLALQEVDRNQTRSAGADLTAIAVDVMDAPEHRFVAALSGNPGAMWMAADGDEQPDSAAYGVALVSRYPVHAWEVVRLAPVPGRVPLRFHGSFAPVMVRDEPRVAVAALVETPLGATTVVCTHLTFVSWWNGWQLRRLRRSLEDRRPPLVLMGDLNMGPERAERVSGLRSAVTAPTFPAHAPTEQLDHILVNGVPEGCGEAKALPLSDHRALVLDV